jgi:putative endonuclease
MSRITFMKGGTVYLLASGRNGTLYVGVTSDLPGRMYEHRESLTPGFTRRFGVKQLVWYENHTRIEDAVQREKNLKHWLRKWKLALIEKTNPQWRDLYREMLVEFGYAAPEQPPHSGSSGRRSAPPEDAPEGRGAAS